MKKGAANLINIFDLVNNSEYLPFVKDGRSGERRLITYFHFLDDD